MRWYAGSDHAGYRLKRALVAALRELGDEVVDLGTNAPDSVDYPTYGETVGRRVVGEAGITALAIQRGVLPPTTNYETPDPDCDLDSIPNVAREQRVDYAMSNSFGFGGTNAALVLARYKGD